MQHVDMLTTTDCIDLQGRPGRRLLARRPTTRLGWGLNLGDPGLG